VNEVGVEEMLVAIVEGLACRKIVGVTNRESSGG